MIIANVNDIIMERFRQAQCFIGVNSHYNQQPTEFQSIPANRILSMAYDYIIVYNGDKQLSFGTFEDIMIFQINYVDDFNIFAELRQYPDTLIQRVRMHDPTCVDNFIVTNEMCFALSFALTELDHIQGSGGNNHGYSYFSSLPTLPPTIIQTLMKQENGFDNDCAFRIGDGPSEPYYPDERVMVNEPDYSRTVVRHNLPQELLNVGFMRGEEITPEGKFMIGYKEDEPLPTDNLPKDVEIVAATKESKVSNVVGVIDLPAVVAGYQMFPVLRQVVTREDPKKK